MGSPWGVKEMEALKFLCCCPKQRVRKKPSYINRLAPLLRVHTAKSKRRRLGRRLCSAEGRASNARCCGLWTLDYRLRPFINKRIILQWLEWLIDWMLSMHPIPLRCWPRVQTQNSAKDENTVTNDDKWLQFLRTGQRTGKNIKMCKNGNPATHTRNPALTISTTSHGLVVTISNVQNTFSATEAQGWKVTKLHSHGNQRHWQRQRDRWLPQRLGVPGRRNTPEMAWKNRKFKGGTWWSTTGFVFFKVLTQLRVYVDDCRCMAWLLHAQFCIMLQAH